MKLRQKASPQQFSDFRPISLIGCMYKVLTKVLANGLNSVMGNVVAQCQPDYVKGRQVLDGMAIAIELVDDANRHEGRVHFI